MVARNTNNELLLKLLEENAQTKQGVADFRELLTDISTDLKRVVSMSEKLHHTVYGNGQAGLVDRIAALEEWREMVNGTIHEAKGGGKVFVFLWGLASAVVGFIVDRVLK